MRRIPGPHGDQGFPDTEGTPPLGEGVGRDRAQQPALGDPAGYRFFLKGTFFLVSFNIFIFSELSMIFEIRLLNAKFQIARKFERTCLPRHIPRITLLFPIASHEVSLAHSLNSAVDQKCPEGDRVQLQRFPAARAPMPDRTPYFPH